VTLDAIVALIPKARAVIEAHLTLTETRAFGWLQRYAGRPVVAKLETQQRTGSFKARGALFALSLQEPGSTVIAPSAGNHGLAVAWAAAQLGMSANVVLPGNASPLKRERILSLGAGVIEAGSTFDAANDEARRLAGESDQVYISPYNDIAVVAGQATAVVELLEERPDVRSLLVPVGGGGLLAGALAARDHLGRSVHVVAAEPEQFASLAVSTQAGEAVRLGRRPTFADGLATNVELGSLTVDVAAGAEDLLYCQLTEEEIAAACLAVFNRESVLAEGAGSAGVAAALHADELGLPEGTVATLVCGGNVHHTTFWQMATFPFRDARLVALADTLGRSIEDEPRRRERSAPRARALAEPSVPVPDDEVADWALPPRLVDSVGDYTAVTESMLDDLVGLARDDGLPLDMSLVDLVRRVNGEVRAQVGVPAEAVLDVREQRLRVLSQLAVAARLAFEWRSPGYEQSAALAGFDLGSLGSPGVNYARFDQPGVPEIERQLADLLGISLESHAVLATSSGMAAFALAVTTISSVTPIRSVVTAPYLYFEGQEMLEYWLGRRVSSTVGHDAGELADAARVCGADAVFADPLANHPDQRMVDVEHLAEELAGETSPPWLVVDASMLPTATAAPVTRALPDRALYFESCSKYLQFGLDIVMSGMVVVPRGLEALARRVRRNLGLGLDRYAAELFPRYRPEEFERRSRAMERAALGVATALDGGLRNAPFRVTFPGLPDHPDHGLARQLGRTGSCVTLTSTDRPLGRDQLEPIVDAALLEARARQVPLVKGVSFGFSTSRLSAAAAMAEAAPPFLRLAVGPLGPRQAQSLADVVRWAVERTTAAWPR
jgi:threonine dehydratase